MDTMIQQPNPPPPKKNNNFTRIPELAYEIAQVDPLEIIELFSNFFGCAENVCSIVREFLHNLNEKKSLIQQKCFFSSKLIIGNLIFLVIKRK